MSHVVIESRNLVKKYGSRKVVDRINFEVYQGECFGLLGPNGAGKTTLLRMICGSCKPTSGDLFVLGLDILKHAKQIKSRMGVVPQSDGLDPDFSVLDNLMVFSKYYGIPSNVAKERATELLRDMHLYDYATQHVNTLSGGLKRRLALCRSLIHRPELMILDEPTTGLDPQVRYYIWSQFEDMKEKGKTIFITTHYMEEASHLCDRIAIMDEGHLLDIGTPRELISTHIGDDVVEFTCNEVDLNYHLNRFGNQYAYQILHNKLRLFLRAHQEPNELLKHILSENIIIRKPTLDDVFLKISGRDLREV